MYNGIEVDLLSLGDADCIVVTRWHESYPHRILIDGGSGADAEVIVDFLRRRNYTNFWAVLCTHLHNDHARGLVKIVRDKRIAIHNGWMHDIRKHVGADALRRAGVASDGVKEVVEATEELTSAFLVRGLVPREPFAGTSAGSVIAGYPLAMVLGPSLPYYRRVIEQFTEVQLPAAIPALSVLARLAGTVPPVVPSGLGDLAFPFRMFNGKLSALLPTPPSGRSTVIPPPLFGALNQSSVKVNPRTQPYNNTSVILGVDFNGDKLLFTADAGSDALSSVGADWNRLLYMGVPHHGSDGNLSQKDIERFLPRWAFISAKGDSSHPSRAIVSGLVKVGTKVASTHQSGHLWFYSGTVPARPDYGPVELMKGTGSPEPVADWMKVLSGV